MAGKHFLLPRADVGRERLAEALRAAGAEVTDVVAYRALPADLDPDRDPDLYRMLLDGAVDVVTFTSAASVRNFAATFGVEQSADLLQQTVVAVCGPVTAEAASRLGIAVSIMPTSTPSTRWSTPSRRTTEELQIDDCGLRIGDSRLQQSAIRQFDRNLQSAIRNLQSRN